MKGKIPLLRYCKVVGTDDENGADRIRVRVIPEDNDIRFDSDCPYAFPLLPKSISPSKPQIGEAVLVFLAETNDASSQRYYIGPLISQMHHISFEPYFKGADSFMRGATGRFDPVSVVEQDGRGIFKNDDDVSIVGRKNADIFVTDDDVRIRAGVKVVNEYNNRLVSFNDVNPAYIKVKYNPNSLATGTKSTTTIVSQKINLLSPTSSNRISGNRAYNLTDRDELVTDEELNDIIADAYRLPYGERLVSFLQKFVKIFNSHTHKWAREAPNPVYTDSLTALAKSELDEGRMLSDTIRIN